MHGHADISRLSDCRELALARITATGMATGLCSLRLARVTSRSRNFCWRRLTSNLKNISAALTLTSNMDIADLFLEPGHRQNRCCFRKHADLNFADTDLVEASRKGQSQVALPGQSWHLLTAMLKFLRLKAALTMSRLRVFCT